MAIQGAATLPQADQNVGSLKQIIESSGSDSLKNMMNDKSVGEADLIQYALSNPKELGMLPERDDVKMAVSDGDPDLLPFEDDEVKGEPGLFGRQRASYADKAKPEMQQTLRQAKAIMKNLEDMKKENLHNGDEVDSTITGSLAKLRDKEEVIKKCLARGAGAANDAYQSMGVDPMDRSAVSRFVSDLNRDVLQVAARQGLDVMVSQMRADQFFGKSGEEEEQS